MPKTVRKISQYLICFAFLLTVFSPLACLAVTDAQSGIKEGITKFQTEAKLPSGSGDLVAVIAGVVKNLLAVMGLILVILIIYAGFTWMTAMGDEKKVETAKTIIKNATIGVILIILAYAIATFIVDETTKAITGSGGGTPPVVTPGR